MTRKRWSILIFIIGFSLLLYPIVAKSITNWDDRKIVGEYERYLDGIGKDMKDKMLEDYINYNKIYGLEYYIDPFDERGNKSSSNILYGVIATIEIPKLRLQLPIFQGATDEHLRNGIGQIEGTSLPIGENDSHSVLAGHNGYARRELFSNIDRLKIGDVFNITSVAGKLEYRVVETIIIQPYETDYLLVEKGKDKVTLLTCTPLGDKRFLVIGERNQ